MDPKGGWGRPVGKTGEWGKKGKTQLRVPVLAKDRWVMRGDTLYMSLELRTYVLST